MDKSKSEATNFVEWLKQNRFKLIFSLLLVIIPMFSEFDIGFLKPSNTSNRGLAWLWEQIYYNPYQITNIVIIFATFLFLSRSTTLMERENDKKEVIHEYVSKMFGENCTLAQNTPSDLYNRLRIGVEQFYFSWLAVWVVWLLLYILKLVFAVYKYNVYSYVSVIDLSSAGSFRVECLLENCLNLTNSFILLFIYLVITTSTVNVGNLSNTSLNGRKMMHTGVCAFILMGFGCFMTDVFSLSSEVSPNLYNEVQFFLRLLIGVVGTISLMAVLGRLNTNFLNIPQWMMFGLYFYAAVQMFYPLTYNSIYKNPHNNKFQNKVATTFQMMEASCDHSNIRYYNININNDCLVENHYNQNAKKEVASNMDMQISENDNILKTNSILTYFAPELEPFFYLYTLIGKICLCLVLCWVNKQNRFVFFLIHKANTLSDSEIMLRRFNDYYNDHT